MKPAFNIASLASAHGCFDLQFRKDTRHERTNSPTYYRWKVQFIITGPKENAKLLDKAQRMLACGKVTSTGNQTRFSVQDIDDIANVVVPFFKKNKLGDGKKKEFEAWQKAVAIVQRNKGKSISKWQRNDQLTLIEIHKLTSKYKQKPKIAKWMDAAKTFAKSLKNGD